MVVVNVDDYEEGVVICKGVVDGIDFLWRDAWQQPDQLYQVWLEHLLLTGDKSGGQLHAVWGLYDDVFKKIVGKHDGESTRS